MTIGVFKELKIDEGRVALLPEHCSALTAKGHEVFIETGAGAALHLSDDDYMRAGAQIAPVGGAIDRARLLVAVKRPNIETILRLSPQQFLFCYLHLDENTPKEYAEALRQTGCTAIAYEWVGDEVHHPLLQPMSRLTGVLLALKGMELVLRHKGKVPVGYGGQAPAVMVIGIGNIGAEATRVFDTNSCRLFLVDKHPETLRDRIGDIAQKSTIIYFDSADIAGSLAKLRAAAAGCDIVLLSAVRRPDLPKSACEYLLRDDDIRAMGSGSVVMDATACIRDFIETSVPTEQLEHVYLTHGVAHYNPDHIPALAPVTASKLLTDATFPFIRKLADGAQSAALADAMLRNGIMVHGSCYRHKHTCLMKGYPWTALEAAC